MSLTASLKQLTEMAEKRDEVHFAFIKQILLMASSLFGILVALHKTPAVTTYSHLAFSIALGLLSLGILFLSIALFAQVAVHKALFVQKKDDLLLQIRDSEHTPKILATEPSKVYRYFEKTGYTALLLSVISLTIYAVLIG
jgi:hypothetical protein